MFDMIAWANRLSWLIDAESFLNHGSPRMRMLAATFSQVTDTIRAEIGDDEMFDRVRCPEA